LKKISMLLIVLLIFLLSVSCLASRTESIMDLIENADQSGEEVITKADTAIGIIIYKILPLVGVLFLGISGIYLATGSDKAKSKVAYAGLGVGVVALAPTLTGWIISLFG